MKIIDYNLITNYVFIFNQKQKNCILFGLQINYIKRVENIEWVIVILFHFFGCNTERNTIFNNIII